MRLLVFLDELYFTKYYKVYKTKFVSANFLVNFAKKYKDIKLSFSFPVKYGEVNNPGNELNNHNYEIYPVKEGWDSIINFYKNYFYYRKQLNNLMEAINMHETIFIRLPSPAGLIIGKIAEKLGKKVIYNIVGDIKNAYKNYRFPMNIPAYFASQVLYKKELSLKGVFLTVGSELTNRFKNKNSIFFIDSLIESKHLQQVKASFQNPIKFLYVGRLLKSKGIFFLIETIKQLRSEFNIELNIVGFGKEESTVEQLSKKFDFINYYGKISNRDKLNKIYKNNDIFILPTLNYPEGFPRVILEAWANGLYVISSKVGGIEGLAKDKENILFFSPGNKEELIQNIKKLLTDNELRKRLKIGTKKVQEKITFEYYSEKLYEILEEN
jgi:glycosyltransferase involved in cell wall biosynthesis